MYKKISLVVNFILISTLLVSCSTTQHIPKEDMPVSFITVYHSKLLLPENATYQWSKGFTRHADRGLIKNVDMWGLIKQSIEQEMQAKGYRHIAEAEQADINISFIAVLASDLSDAEIESRYGLVPVLTVPNVNKNNYEKGTLIFDVVNPKTNKLAWRAAGQALTSLKDIPLEERESRIDVFVKKLLAFLPEK